MDEDARLTRDAPILEAIPAAACVAESEELRIRAYNRAFAVHLSPRFAERGAVGLRIEEALQEEPLRAVLMARQSGVSLFQYVPGREGEAPAPAFEVHLAPIRSTFAPSPWYVVSFWETSDLMTLELTRDMEPAVRTANERLTISALEARAAAEHETIARAEAQRRASETDAVLSAISDILFVYDMDGRVLRANPAAHQAIGLDPAGMSWSEVARAFRLRKTDGARVEEPSLPAVRARAGESSAPESLLITTADAQERVVSPSATPVELAPGQLGVVSVWRDVTERERLIAELRRTTEALKRADQHKDEFFAVLSHELRNPLAPIRNSLYVLEHAAPGGEQARRAQHVISRQVQHVTRLVDDLLDLNRVTRGKVQLQPEPFALGPVVLRTAEDYRASFAPLGLQFKVDVAPEPLWIHADPTRVVQAIGNLLQNACKFTEPGGLVELSLRAEAGYAVISVRDTGSGIEPDQLERMFDAFAQADRTQNRSGGLGLGLALVKGFVELQGGSVRAQSGGPGRGSEFQIRLPLVAPPAMASQPASDPRTDRRLRILVVEDNPDAAESLADALGLMGHEAAMALSGPDALALARQHPPDVVICDIGLPGMDGYEVARAFRADPALQSCPLIALSGYAQQEDRARSAESGFAAHISKPPDMDALEKLLARLTQSARAKPG